MGVAGLCDVCLIEFIWNSFPVHRWYVASAEKTVDLDSDDGSANLFQIPSGEKKEN